VDIRLTEEQRQLASLAAELAALSSLQQGHGPDDVREPAAEVATVIAEAGLLGLRLPEQAGGAGGSSLDAALVAEQWGRHLACFPLLGTWWAGDMLVAAHAGDDLLSQVASGSMRLAPVLHRSLTTFDTSTTDVGRSAAVAWDGAQALHGVRLDGSEVSLVELGPALSAVVDLTREVREVRPTRTAAGQTGTAVGAGARAHILAFALTTLSADLLGVMEAALDEAVAYSRAREQFGAPIGSFQAVQHLAAEAHVSVEATRSAVWFAAWAVDELPADEALLAARTAKAFASANGREVAETAMQMLGGLSQAWESTAHVRTRRVLADRQMLGTEDEQYARISDATIGTATRPEEG
jgi:alkylation response protein AidB-like acyl-CoA dehydrogenase